MFNIELLRAAAAYDHTVDSVELIETHISWVLLTGEYAYKIKKPVNFGFLDFSTLARRKHFCAEELRLNRRLAADIYLAVVTINLDADAYRINGQGEVVEYAVKMRQFAQECQLDRMLEQSALTPARIDAFAERIARFHDEVDVAGADSDFGTPATVWQPVAENFSQIREHAPAGIDLAPLDRLAMWSERMFRTITPQLAQRKRDGFIRECHGDLHLRNMAWYNDTPIAFDCIEFNPDLRWIDVISEIAFLVMDLHDRHQARLANRLLNRYLETTGDYAGLVLLRFYLVYRAMVRAKVDVLRLSQAGIARAERQAEIRDFEEYLHLAERFTVRSQAMLILTHGLSASGKTSVTQQLLEHSGAIRLRSDVERKRLAGMDAAERGGAAIDSGLYASHMSERTYARLREQTRELLTAGYSVIVDAAFLQRAQREIFYALAAEQGITCVVLALTARPEILRKRITARRGDASDADLAVLEHQLASTRPLEADELFRCLHIDTEQPVEGAEIYRRLAAFAHN